MSKKFYECQLESIERMKAENKELHEKVIALENVIRGMNAFFNGDPQ